MDINWERKVGQNIRKFRIKKGLKLQPCADKFRCGLRAWQKFETGKNFEINTLIKIAKILEVEPYQLLK
jgi:transcriptional regulator with XRE-family HTH domain